MYFFGNEIHEVHEEARRTMALTFTSFSLNQEKV